MNEIYLESNKEEFILQVDDFGNTASVKGILGLARNIQSLFFLEQGTYPHHPNMGIGITTYSFEFLDDETIYSLKQVIESQIATYIPNNNINDILIQAFDRENSINKVLGINFLLNTPIDGKKDFILLFNKENPKSEIISEILI